MAVNGDTNLSPVTLSPVTYGFPSRNENNLIAVNDAFDYLENVKNGIVPSNN